MLLLCSDIVTTRVLCGHSSIYKEGALEGQTFFHCRSEFNKNSRQSRSSTVWNHLSWRKRGRRGVHFCLSFLTLTKMQPFVNFYFRARNSCLRSITVAMAEALKIWFFACFMSLLTNKFLTFLLCECVEADFSYDSTLAKTKRNLTTRIFWCWSQKVLVHY